MSLVTRSHFYDRQIVTGGAEITEVLGELGLTANPATIPPSGETK